MNLVPIIKPMPENIRAIKKRIYRPMPPPIFMNWPRKVTAKDIALARELFMLLDDESKDWYGRDGIFDGL